MGLEPEQSLSLVDGAGRELGRIVIEHIDQDLVFGQFTPGAEYARVEQLFIDYAEAANEQALSLVGDLDRRIASLGLRLASGDCQAQLAIHDVQIGDGLINFRLGGEMTSLKASESVNGSPGVPLVPHAEQRHT